VVPDKGLYKLFMQAKLLMNVLMGYETTHTAGKLLGDCCWYCDPGGAVDWALNLVSKLELTNS
jgi:hypothetical protein